MAFKFERLELPEVVLIEAQAFEDNRGWFMEAYKHSEFAAQGITETFVQDNCSHSVRSVLRGLHYQKHPKAQAKLIQVITGRIFDVEVDLRRGSPTYARWVGVSLSEHDRRMLYVPVGFAHGFCVLSETAVVVYKVTAEYTPALDRGILWNDPEIAIHWPIQNPILSTKDARLPPIGQADHDFSYAAADS